jgi:hypothetical protein
MSIKTAQQKLQEAVIAMDLEQLERFNEKAKPGLQDWELANIAETILGPRPTITDVARSNNKREAINESGRNGGSKGKTPEQLIEGFREQQYNAYRKCGMSEAEASSAANFKPKK